MGDRFDILYRFSTDGGSTWVDLTPQVDSQQTVLTHNLCTNNFTSAKDEATFVMPETPLFEPDGVTPTPKKKLIDALLGNSDILIHINAPFPTQKVLWDDNAVVWNGMHLCWSDSGRRFTGYADRSAIDIRSFPLPPKLTIKVQDVSVLHLDDKVDMHICWESYTVKTIVRNLLTLAGYDASHVSLSEADTTVMSATDNVTLPFVVDKDKAKTYRQYIDLLLFEAGGYVIDFTEDGHVELVHLAWDGTVPAVRTIDNPMNAEGVQMRGAWLKEDGAKVTWSSLMWSAQEQLWMSDIDQSIESGVLVGDTIKPGRYWPDGAELKPQYFEYDAKLLDSAYRTRESRRQNEDLSIIMAKNINIRMDAMQGTTPYVFPKPAGYPIPTSPVDFTAPPYNLTDNPSLWATKAWVLLYNSTAEDINLTFFTIYGDVLYRYKLNTMETQGAKNPKEYESTYIYDEAQAQRFVQFYWHFLQTSRYQFTWSEPCKWNELNEVVAVGIKGNGSTQKALIASKKSKWINGNTEVLAYTAIGVDTYTPATLVPTVIVPSTAKQTAVRPSLTATFASTPSFTLSQWEAYGTPSAPQTWTVTNASSFKPGYIALILGEISDLDDTPVTLYMDVTAVDTVNGTISGTGIRIDYTVPVDVDNWDFEMEASSAVRNDRLAPYSSLDPNSYTDIQLTSLQKGYGVLEYWSCTGTNTFFGGNPGTQTTTGSAPILRVAKDETDPEITVTMHSLDNSLSIERKITIINETEYDHDFGAWEPNGGYQLPDHYTINGVDYNILDGDFFVAKSTFTVGGETYTQGVPYMYGIPTAYSWHNEMQATAANSQRMLRALATVLNSPATQPSVGALYGWFRDLVALNAVIQNLTAINLNVGPGTGLAGSGFRFRALNDDGNGSPIFDVYYNDKVVFRIDVTSGDIFFGGGLTYHASSDTIEANNATFNGIQINNANGGEADFGSAIFRQQNPTPITLTISSSTGQGRTIYDWILATFGLPTPPLSSSRWYSEYYPCTVSSDASVAYIRASKLDMGVGPTSYGAYFYDSNYQRISALDAMTNSQSADKDPFSVNDVITTERGGNVMYLYNLPTTSVGLTSGRVWNDNGTLKIVT